MHMEEEAGIGWQQERAELQREICRLQEELAETWAQKDQLESRTKALGQRLVQTLSLGPLEEAHRDCRRKMRACREKEARQALHIHRLQNKVTEYRDRLHLEVQAQEEHVQLISTEQRLRDQHSHALESALIRLEEEQQRSEALAHTNSLLREELDQSEQSNATLREDLEKLMVDWSRAVKEVAQWEADWQMERESSTAVRSHHQSTLLSLWRAVVHLKLHYHILKTASDRDLWQLRSDFSHLSKSVLSSCSLLRPALTQSSLSSPAPVSPALSPLPALSSTMAADSSPPPALSSTMAAGSSAPPCPLAPFLLSSVSLGTFHLDELGPTESAQIQENCEVEKLKQELQSVSLCLSEQSQECTRLREGKSNLQAVSTALLRLARLLRCPSPPVSSEGILMQDLSSLLEAISQTESTLQRHQLQQQALEQHVRELGEEKVALETSLRHLESEQPQEEQQRALTLQRLHEAQFHLHREQEESTALRSEVQELQLRAEELQRERDRLKRDGEQQGERRQAREEQACRRVELENVQLKERGGQQQMEIHRLKVALEQEQLDRQRAEEESADMRDALSKSREVELRLSSSETLLKRQLGVTQDALDKMSTLNSTLGSDKRDLHVQLSQVEANLSDSQSELQTLRSEVNTLQRELKAVEVQREELRCEWEASVELLGQHRALQADLKLRLEHSERALGEQQEELRKTREQLEQLLSQKAGLQKELHEACEELRRTQRSHQAFLGDTQRIQEQQDSERRQSKYLHQELLQLRSLCVSLRQQLSQAQKDLLESQVGYYQLQAHIQVLQETKSTLQGEIGCLKVELERSEKEHKISAQAKEMLRHQVEERRRETGLWQKQLEDLNLELSKRNAEVKVLRSCVDALEMEKRDTDGELQSVREELQETRHDLDRTVQELDGACQQIQSLEQKHAEDQAALHLREVEGRQRLQRITRMEAEREENQEQQQKLLHQIQMLEKVNENKVLEMQRLQQECTKMEELLDGAFEKIKTIEGDKAKQEEQFCDKIRKMEKLQQEQEQELEQLLDRMEKLEQQNQEKAKETKRLCTEQDEMKQRFSATSSLLEKMREERRIEQESAIMLQAEEERRQKERSEEEQKSHQELSEQIKKLESLNKKQEHDLDKLLKEQEQKKEEIKVVEKLQQENMQELLKKLQEMVKQTESLEAENREQVKRVMRLSYQITNMEKANQDKDLQIQRLQIEGGKMAAELESARHHNEVLAEEKSKEHQVAEESREKLQEQMQNEQMLMEKLGQVEQKMERLQSEQDSVEKQMQRIIKEQWTADEEKRKRDQEAEKIVQRLEEERAQRDRELELLKVELSITEEQKEQVEKEVKRLEKCLEHQMRAIRECEQEAELHKAELDSWAELLHREELQRQDLEAAVTKMEEKEKCLQRRLQDTEENCEDMSADLSEHTLQLQESTSELKASLEQQQKTCVRLKEVEETCMRLKEEAKDAAEQMQRREEENVLLRSKVRDLSQEVIGVREQWEEDKRQHQLGREDQERQCRRRQEELGERKEQRNLEEQLKEKETELEEEKMEQERISIQMKEVKENMEKEWERRRTLEEKAKELNRTLEETQQNMSSLKQELDQEVRQRGTVEQEMKGLKLKLESQGPAERLAILQRVVAELELEQKRLVQKITRLQHDNQRLREERDTLKEDGSTLRETIRQVELHWFRMQQTLPDHTSQNHQGPPTLTHLTEMERLRARVRHLEEQKTHFIKVMSRNNQQLQSLHCDLSTSLTVVSDQTTPTVLQLETQRLDQSIREEELCVSLNQL